MSAMYHLAQMYEQGIGVQKDLVRARAMYQLAADNGHPQAIAWLKSRSARAKWLLDNGH